MALLTYKMITIAIVLIGFPGFGSALRIVSKPEPYSDVADELKISCFTDGPAYIAKSIISIEIMKKREDTIIAAINKRQELKKGSGSKENMKAEGHVDSADARKSHLTLTIEKPRIQDAGIYRCRVFFTDESTNILEDSVSGNVTYQECETPECHAIANRMEKLMDMDVDPCVDFSEFACGKFYKEAVIPDDRIAAGSFLNLVNEAQKLHEELLTGPLISNMTFEVKMRSLYNACMDTDAIERHGLSDYTNKAKEDWPTLNPEWTSSSFDLQSVINKYFRMFNPVLFNFDKRTDNSVEPPVLMLEIAGPKLLLDNPTLRGKRHSKKIMALEMLYKEFSMALGATEKHANTDAKDVVDLFRELAKLQLDPVDLYNISKIFNPTTFEEMDAKYPYLNWTEAVQSMFDIKTKKIEQRQKMNIIDTKYVEKLGDFISRTDVRIIQNMFGFFHARKFVAGSTKRMRAIELNFNKVASGVEKETSRNVLCVAVVDAIYNHGMAKLVSKKKFSKNAKKFMDGMIDNLKKLFIDGFQSLDWMGDTSKRIAVDKVIKMKANIGIPESHFEDVDIENTYKDYIVKGQYISDILQNARVGNIESWNDIGETVKAWKWPRSITEVNAYFSPLRNIVVFPLGILQAPFFDQNSPGYLNYGAIGSIIGHEIGHAFDAIGKRFDGNGRVKDWWTNEDNQKYEENAKCFVDQYSKFNVTIGNSTYPLDGDLTQTDNVADTVGLNNAYKAYKMYQKASGTNDLPLPRLRLDNDQLFFLSFAQVWCSKVRPAAIKSLLLTDSHSPERFRIIGSLQNNAEFAKVYKCKAGNYMNPAKKCTLW